MANAIDFGSLASIKRLKGGEMNFDDLFPELAEEEVRLRGGQYSPKHFIPIEEISEGMRFLP